MAPHHSQDLAHAIWRTYGRSSLPRFSRLCFVVDLHSSCIVLNDANASPWVWLISFVLYDYGPRQVNLGYHIDIPKICQLSLQMLLSALT